MLRVQCFGVFGFGDVGSKGLRSWGTVLGAQGFGVSSPLSRSKTIRGPEPVSVAVEKGVGFRAFNPLKCKTQGFLVITRSFKRAPFRAFRGSLKGSFKGFL